MIAMLIFGADTTFVIFATLLCAHTSTESFMTD
jgi:hypothetical protein